MGLYILTAGHPNASVTLEIRAVYSVLHSVLHVLGKLLCSVRVADDWERGWPLLPLTGAHCQLHTDQVSLIPDRPVQCICAETEMLFNFLHLSSAWSSKLCQGDRSVVQPRCNAAIMMQYKRNSSHCGLWNISTPYLSQMVTIKMNNQRTFTRRKGDSVTWVRQGEKWIAIPWLALL